MIGVSSRGQRGLAADSEGKRRGGGITWTLAPRESMGQMLEKSADGHQ